MHFLALGQKDRPPKRPIAGALPAMAAPHRTGTSIGAQLRRPCEMHSSALRASTSALTSQAPDAHDDEEEDEQHHVVAVPLALGLVLGINLGRPLLGHPVLGTPLRLTHAGRLARRGTQRNRAPPARAAARVSEEKDVRRRHGRAAASTRRAALPRSGRAGARTGPCSASRIRARTVNAPCAQRKHSSARFLNSSESSTGNPHNPRGIVRQRTKPASLQMVPGTFAISGGLWRCG